MQTMIPIERTPNVCGGDARLAGRRITVWMLVEAKRSGMDDDEIAVQYDPPLSSDELTTADARSVRAARPPLPSVSPSSHPAPSCFSRYACTSSSHTIAVAICEYLETDTKVSLEYIAKAIDKLEAWEDLH